MARQTSNSSKNSAVQMLKGMLAGAVGVWALDRVTWLMYNREDPEALDREQKARTGGLDPAHAMAEKLAELADLELNPRQPNPTGIAIHYALGVLPGAMYAAFRPSSEMNLKRAAAFGTGLFVLHDEVFNWMLGFSGPPNAYPWQAHVRGLVGHLAYGVATEGALAALDRIPSPVARKQDEEREQPPAVPRTEAIAPPGEGPRPSPGRGV